MYLASDEMLHSHQPRPLVMERRWKSKVEIAPNCPRCASSNTKFCYYNNYSLSQPRYFCKGCKRYWTKGGSLRNVPAGGGRKSRRTKPVRITPCGGSSDNDVSHGTKLATSDPSIEGSHGDPAGKQDIDLAAVFAKFVNSTEETNTYSDIYGSSNQNTRLEDKFVDLQTQSSTSEDGAQFFSGLGEGFPSGDHILLEGQAREFSGHDPNSFGMQNMFSDELAQDPMWSDSATLINLTWQLQELGSYCDDQTKFSSTGYENWSTFDLPAYDIFSKPYL